MKFAILENPEHPYNGMQKFNWGSEVTATYHNERATGILVKGSALIKNGGDKKSFNSKQLYIIGKFTKV